MLPEKIKEIRKAAGLKQQGFCDAINKLSWSLLPEAQEITRRTLRGYETNNELNHREPTDWFKFVLKVYAKRLKK